MEYKALITGSNSEMMDAFFKHMHQIETMTTSNRYGDVARHIKYFSPDIFVYCIYHETKEDYSKIVPIKHLLSKHKLPFVVVGSEEDCAEFERIAANITDFMIQDLSETDAIQKKLSTFLEEWREDPPVQPAEPEQPGQIPVMQPEQMPYIQPVPAGQMPYMQPMPPQPQPVPVAPHVPPVTQSVKTPAPPAKKPAADAGKPDKETAKKTPPVPRRKRKRRTVGRGRILVIDDNPLMLKVIKEHLHEEYDLATATSGQVALRFLQRRQVDLILLDYEMPDEDGPAVLKKLRANDKTMDVPVVFLTGISDRKKIQKALMLQPDGYLLKPIDHEKLISTIKQYID